MKNPVENGLVDRLPLPKAPTSPAAELFNLGLSCRQSQDLSTALAHFGAAIKLQPNFADAYIARGVVLNDMQDHLQAIESYKHAIAINPNLETAHYNQANALRALGKNQAAVSSYNKAIELAPNLADAYSNRGNALIALQKASVAMVSFNRAIALQPDAGVNYLNRGVCHAELGDPNAAYADLSYALKLNPQLAEAHVKRAAILAQFKRYKDAIAELELAYNAKPTLDYLLGHFASAKNSSCDWRQHPDHLDAIRHGMENGEQVIQPWTSLSIVDDPQLQKIYTEAWLNGLVKQDKDKKILTQKPYVKKKKIRIGYFSTNFHDHPVMHLMKGIFQSHDQNLFDLIGFSFAKKIAGKYQESVAKCFNKLLYIDDFSEDDIVALSHDLEIDIAVDLTGFTDVCKPVVFYKRCAPIQINFLGYAGTLGSPQWDYIIADEFIIPKESTEFYSEKVIYLPDCFQPNDIEKNISDANFSRQDFQLPPTEFVYCCSNNLYKITPQVFDVWMRVLNQVPGSVMWLFTEHADAMGNLKKEAQLRGVDPDRLIFAKRMPALADHLARYRLADLFLDTFPYNAHTTASDALWAGLPVLTCAGKSFASRVAGSLLTAVGLPELITNNHHDFEKMAITLATQPQVLTGLKQRLAANRLTTPLFDTERFTRNLESAYRKALDRHVAGLPPDHIHFS